MSAKKAPAKKAVAPKALTPWQVWTAKPGAITDLCDRIMDGESMVSIAHSLGVRGSALSWWVAAAPDRPARVREARAKSAATFDGQALQYLLNATDPFSLAQAREVAQHLRWRASKIAPGDYGEKLDLTHAGELKVTGIDIRFE